MHEAWLIDDIWRLLASYLNDKDLAVLAQTCKALYPLASAEKWKTITSFSGLLACLPQRHQCDKLQAKDLERMDFYSAMVQAIELGSKDDPHPLCVPSRYDAALEKQKREVTLRYGEMLDSVERKKRNEERKRMKMEKKKARARRRGTVPQVIDEDRKTEESMDLSELKTTIDEDDPDAPGRKMWADLWGEIAELRPQSLFLPNVRRITIYRATCDCLVPLVGISGSRLEKLYVRFIHGEKSEHLTGNFLYRLQDVSKLEYLFVRDSMDLIPRKVIAHAPLRQLRLDPRISRDCWDDYSFKSKPVLVGILEKESIEHLTIGLSREWYVWDIS